MNVSETRQELVAHLDRITRGLPQRELQCFTTARIASALSISRNLASQYLNELTRDRVFVKAGTRPFYYFHRRSLERYLQRRVDSRFYPSVEELLSTQAHAMCRDFDYMIGHDSSLATLVEQCRAALHYPPNGLPFLLLGEAGTGKTLLARLSLEYLRNNDLVDANAQLSVIDCSRFKSDDAGFMAACEDDGGAFALSHGGIVFLANVDALSFEARDYVLAQIEAAPSANQFERPRFILASSLSVEAAEIRGLSGRIPLTLTMPALRERTDEERNELVLSFLQAEGRRMGVDVSISRSACHHLASANYPGNITELKACVTACCAEAYLKHDGDRLTVRTYQLPAQALEGKSYFPDENEGVFINVADGAAATIDSDSASAMRAIDSISEIVRSAAEGGKTHVELLEEIASIARDHEDALAFSCTPLALRTSAHEEIICGVLDRLNVVYELGMTRKEGRIIARLIGLQLWPSSALVKRTAAHDTELSALVSLLNRLCPFEATVVSRLSQQIDDALGVSLDSLSFVVMLMALRRFTASRRKCTAIGIVLCHGCSTASSIADAANRFLHAHVFEAVDMQYDQSVADVLVSIRQIIRSYAYCRSVAFLVDMGSLEGVFEDLGEMPRVTVGVVNNVSTGLAIEVGAGLLAGRGLDEVLNRATAECAWHYRVERCARREDAVLLCSESGADAAEKVRQLITKSIGHEISIRLLTYDYHQLVVNGTDDGVFRQYIVRAVIGTMNPEIDGLPFIALEDIISGDANESIEQVFGVYLTREELAAFRQGLLRNMTLENVISSISILNPEKLFDDIKRAVDCLQAYVSEVIEPRIIIGLYIHLCCLVERIVTRTPIESYVNEREFEERHFEFIESFRASFSDITSRYRVEVPVAEIAYVYDYIYSPRALRKHAISENGIPEDE